MTLHGYEICGMQESQTSRYRLPKSQRDITMSYQGEYLCQVDQGFEGCKLYSSFV